MDLKDPSRAGNCNYVDSRAFFGLGETGLKLRLLVTDYNSEYTQMCMSLLVSIFRGLHAVGAREGLHGE